MKAIEKIKYLHWRKGFISQHSPECIAKSVKPFFSFSDVKYGNIKQNQGDVVIVNLQPMQDFMTITEYLSHSRDIAQIDQEGIYTNIYFGRKYFNEVMLEATKKPFSSWKKLWFRVRITLNM